MSEVRCQLITWIDDARKAGARQSKACQSVGISAKTYQRWQHPDNVADGRLESTEAPANKLGEFERRRIIQLVNSSDFANSPPCQIVPVLADMGIYLASESTIYRILKAENQLAHRETAKPRKSITKPEALVARSPNELYSWDITYLPTVVKGQFYYLYMVMDIFSRKIVGWQVYQEESSALAGDLMTDICQRESVCKNQVTLHSDNGSPMKGATMLATLQELGVMPSFSRPSVSNDNPYSESLFRTLKYRPEYPGRPFCDLAQARVWVTGFVDWYNHHHRHSAISFVTPQQRHSGEDMELLKQRTRIYSEAKQKAPNRWSGDIRNWDRKASVNLNPEKGKEAMLNKQAA